jgi:hypothetical protein
MRERKSVGEMTAWALRRTGLLLFVFGGLFGVYQHTMRAVAMASCGVLLFVAGLIIEKNRV